MSLCVQGVGATKACSMQSGYLVEQGFPRVFPAVCSIHIYYCLHSTNKPYLVTKLFLATCAIVTGGISNPWELWNSSFMCLVRSEYAPLVSVWQPDGRMTLHYGTWAQSCVLRPEKDALYNRREPCCLWYCFRRWQMWAAVWRSYRETPAHRR